MINDRIASLIARKLNGEITPAEQRELTEHFKTNPADQYFEELLAAYWNSQPGTSLHDSSADDHFSRILQRADENDNDELRGAIVIPEGRTTIGRRRILRRISLAVAAAAAIALLIWNFSPSKSEPAIKAPAPENEVVAKKGMRTKLLLPDGSQVWLNSDSRLTYSNFQNDTVRQVELEGEAYFDVVKNPAKPFIVRTSAFDVRVLGTAFDVKSYPGEPNFETFLIRGIVEVTRRGQPHAKKNILKPLEKLVLPITVLQKTDTTEGTLTDPKNISGPKRIIAPKNLPDSSISEISWVYDKLSFDGESFRDMARKMERWFNVKITFHDDKVAADTKRYHWSFTNQTIQQALQELKIIIPFSYRITGNGSEVIIDKE